MKGFRSILLLTVVGLLQSLPSPAQINGWDLIKGLIELSENASKLTDNCFQLTEDRLWAGGSIYYPNKIDLNSHFNMELDVFLGCKDAKGADGIVFIFSPKMAMGLEGGGMGFQGVSPSIGIELDTWQNTDQADPAADHVAILENGVVHHNRSLTKPKTVKNLEDCETHRLEIIWNAFDKNLDIYLDGSYVTGIQKDIVLEVFNGESEVFWGVTSSTGGYSNQHKVCFDKINFKPASAIANSYFKKLEVALLENETVSLQTKFPTGSTKFLEDSSKELDELAAFLQTQPDMSLGIYGHSLNGTKLSKKQADAVANYLIQKGIDKSRILTKGLGKDYPPLDSKQQRERIEIYIFKPFP